MTRDGTGTKPLGQKGLDLTDVLDAARDRGFVQNFEYGDGHLSGVDNSRKFAAGESWIVESTTVDMGTDPGDEATVYLIETNSGERGYIVVPASFYAEPGKADFIDQLRSHPRSSRN